MNLRGYIAIVRRRWVSIVVVAVIVTAVAGAYSLLAPKSYAAQTRSFVALTSTTVGGDVNALQGAQFAAQRVKSYTEIVGTPEVLDPVIAALKLPYTTDQLAEMVSASNPSLTVLIDVTATTGNAAQAAEIANAVSIQMGRVIERLETPAKSTTPPVKVSLIDPARVPSSPSSPNLVLNLAVGLLLGLAAGLIWALVRHSMDNTVKSPDELATLVKDPVLGVVSFDREFKTRHVVALDAKSRQSEPYRTIRANLAYVSVDKALTAVVVTSAAPGDGKTTTACNLAVALAQGGKKVCLVEADLRRPRIGVYLEVDSAVGLTDVLTGGFSLEAALQPWGRNLLQVLSSGRIPPNPSEILGSEQMATLLTELRDSFDIVIIDAPPLLVVSDAAVLAAEVDGAILVTRYGKSTRDELKHAVAALGQVRATLLGTVLNAVPDKELRGYGYGDGAAYGQDPESLKDNPPVMPAS